MHEDKPIELITMLRNANMLEWTRTNMGAMDELSRNFSEIVDSGEIINIVGEMRPPDESHIPRMMFMMLTHVKNGSTPKEAVVAVLKYYKSEGLLRPMPVDGND